METFGWSSLGCGLESNQLMYLKINLKPAKQNWKINFLKDNFALFHNNAQQFYNRIRTITEQSFVNSESLSVQV